VTTDGKKIQVFYFRDFTEPIASFNEQATLVSFDITCTNIIVSHENKIKLLGLKH